VFAVTARFRCPSCCPIAAQLTPRACKRLIPGGPDDGPFLAIDVGESDNLEAPSLRVEGDRLVLQNEECARPGGGYDFYDYEYTWSLDGDTLVIERVTNQCADRVAETILTSRPWTKSG
jgi:hypothetical protein